MDQRSAKSRIRQLLQLPDSRMPLDELCLLISQMAGADIDVDDELRKLDIAARAVPPSFNGLMSHLFQGPAAIRGNAEDYYNIRNSLLSEVHRTGLGIPITMSVLGIELGRRVGVGIVGVGMPGHFLVRSENDRDLFADPFGGGRLLDREGVRRLFATITSGRAPWNEAYFRTVTARDIVFRILNNISVACNKNPPDAVNLAWVLELLSWFPNGEPFDPKAAQRAMARYN